MKKNLSKIFMILISVVVVCSVSVNSLAASVDTSAKASLTINFTVDGKRIPGGKFELYRIADISKNGSVSLTAPFSGYPIVFEPRSAHEMRTLALTLKGYVISKNLKADFTNVTDSNGQVKFQNIPLGMYLVVGSAVNIGNITYVPEAFIVTLPSEGEDKTWDYSVSVRAKAIYNNTNIPTDVRVVKVWDDDGDKSARTESVTVDLYSGDRYYSTIVLSKENNWHYTWNDLPGIDWTVVERNVPDGYKVFVERDKFSFVITNTKDSDGGDDPDKTTKPGTSDPDKTTKPGTSDPDKTTKPGTSDPDKTTKPGTSDPDKTTKPGTSDPDKTTKPGTSDPDKTTKPGTSDPDKTTKPGIPDPDKTTKPGASDPDATSPGGTVEPTGGTTGNGPSDTEGENPSDKEDDKPTLPQTGMLWWPVPVMALFGILFIMLGWRLNRRSEDEN